MKQPRITVGPWNRKRTNAKGKTIQTKKWVVNYRQPDTLQKARPSFDTKAQAEAHYQAVTRVKQEKFFSFGAPGGDPWFMAKLLAFESEFTGNFEIELDAYARNVAPVTLGVDLWGVTNWPDEADDHHVQIMFNETEVADEWFDGLVNYPVQMVLTGDR